MKWLIIFSIFCISLMIYAGNVVYFPKGRFEPFNNELDDMLIEHISEDMVALKEPSLWEVSKKSYDEIYRFKYTEKCIRVEIKQSGDAVAYIKTFLHDDGKLIITESIKNAPQKYISDLKEKLEKANFWQVKPSDYPGYIETNNGRSRMRVMNGPVWIFEGIKMGKYQVFDVQNPADSRFATHEMFELGNWFIKLETLPDTIKEKSWDPPCGNGKSVNNGANSK